jgi:hypothetical protein
MAERSEEIDQALRQFIEAQRLFFVATAPLAGSGHINLSPKGLDTFRILGPTRVAYADLNGSGVETIAHIRENGRLTIMFCAFEGKPKILRLYGRGTVVEPNDPEFESLLRRFAANSRPRSVIVLNITRIAESCGFGVPLYAFVGDRDQLPAWAERKGAEGILAYQRQKNAASIDGLPGLDSAQRVS